MDPTVYGAGNRFDEAWGGGVCCGVVRTAIGWVGDERAAARRVRLSTRNRHVLRHAPDGVAPWLRPDANVIWHDVRFRSEFERGTERDTERV